MSLIVNKISKAFGDTKVLEDISFIVEPTEIVCIKGKSGE